jgi:hypothetical protein
MADERDKGKGCDCDDVHIGVSPKTNEAGELVGVKLDLHDAQACDERYAASEAMGAASRGRPSRANSRAFIEGYDRIFGGTVARGVA